MFLVTLGMGVAAAPAAAAVQSDSSAQVRASVSYRSVGSFRYALGRLRIFRAGRLTVDRPLCPPFCGWGPGAAPPTRFVRVRDLDRDGEPEVLLDLYSSGAHCCTRTLAFSWDGRRYASTSHDWGNVGYRLANLGGDSRPEFASLDDRFAYAFAAYAFSRFPVAIWRFADGAFFNVTQSFPRTVARDSERHWRAHLAARAGGGDSKPALAAWVATQYVLRRGGAAWARLEAIERSGVLDRPGESGFCPCGRAFLRELRRFLVQTGYAR